MFNITANGKTTTLEAADPMRYRRLPDGSELYRVLASDATKGTSSSPRTEKRELPGNWLLRNYQWHVLVGRFEITQMPLSGKLILGQIHGASAPTPAVKILTAPGGNLRCEVRAAPGDAKSPVTAQVPLLEGDNWYGLAVDSAGRGLCYLNGDISEFDLSQWGSVELYFKQGAYSIDKDSDAEVIFSHGNYCHGDAANVISLIGTEIVARMAELEEFHNPAPEPEPGPEPEPEPEPTAKFKLGDLVRKTRGSQWHGRVVGTYSTELTPEGYAVESSTEHGSVQIYPASALEAWDGSRDS